MLAITPPSPPTWRTYFVLSFGSAVTQAITAPLFDTADTSQLVAPFGIFLLSSNTMLVTSASAIPELPTKTFELDDVDDFNTGSTLALAVKVIAPVAAYVPSESPTFVSPSNQPNAS